MKQNLEHNRLKIKLKLIKIIPNLTKMAEYEFLMDPEECDAEELMEEMEDVDIDELVEDELIEEDDDGKY
jgi:hypothetical protein